MRIRWIGLLCLIMAVPSRSDADDGVADPDVCRTSWLPYCPDTQFVAGFDDKLGNITKYHIEVYSDFVIGPIDFVTLDQVHCRALLRSLFFSLANAASNITTKVQEIVFNPLSAEFVHEWDQIYLRTIRKHLQHAETDLNGIQSSVDEALRFIATAPHEIICQHAVHFVTTTPPHSHSPTSEVPDVFKQSHYPHNLLKSKFDSALSALLCLTDHLSRYPLHIAIQAEIADALRSDYDHSLAHFAGARLRLPPAQGNTEQAAPASSSSRFAPLAADARVPVHFLFT
jgi:hypothetical protein